jgi:hypothetical protein
MGGAALTKIRRPPSRGWRYLPAVSSPIGGGMIELGHGGTWAAVTVGAAPYAVCALLYAVFGIGYLAAVLRYLCAGPGGQEAMERLIAASASAMVAILARSGQGQDGPGQATQPGDGHILR